MPLTTLAQLGNVRGKRVLVRVDFNVPVGPKGEIDEDGDQRIRESLPTIQFLRERGARVVLLAHLGRPRGRDESLSLAPVCRRLAKLLGENVRLVDTSIEDDHLAEKQLDVMRDGDVTLLENIRFYKGEEANSVFLARRLAQLGVAYVNDAFAVSHREAASIVGIAKLLPSYAGLLMEKEVTALSRLLQRPARPFVVLMGGAKISTKLPTLKKLLSVADTVLIGGGMANNFFAALGFGVGKSLVSPDDVKLAKEILETHRRKIVLPTDVLAADRIDDAAAAHYRRIDMVGPREYIVDLGADSIREWAGILRAAQTIVWNGPVGLFEHKRFSHGSTMLGRVIASRSSGKAFGVIGGGETVQAMLRTGMAEYVDHVSTGGGAMLEFLSGKPLPGVAALERAGGSAKAAKKKVAKKHAAPKKIAAKAKPAKKAAAKKKKS